MHRILEYLLRRSYRLHQAIYDHYVANRSYYGDKRLQVWDVHVNRYMRYRKRWLINMDVQTILDVGANVGEFAAIARSLFPAARIYAFEPIPDCCAQIRAKAIGNLTLYEVALSDADGEAEFFVSSWAPSSSLKEMAELHRQNWPHSAENTPIRVPVRRLDSLEPELDLQPEILVKVDIQGAEAEFIEGGRNVLSKSKVIIIEAAYRQLYEDEAMFDGVYTRLRELGFSFQGVLKQSQHKENDSYLQADFIFVK